MELEPKSMGYIPIARSFFENDLWIEKRIFSKAEAWIWLITNARYSEGTKSELIRSRKITWERGQLVGAIRFLQKAWGWKSKHKVQHFLEYLKNEEMIITDDSQGITIITLLNYENYNQNSGTPTGKKGGRTTNDTLITYITLRDGEGTAAGTHGGQQGDSKGTPGGQNCNKGIKEIIGGGHALTSAPKPTILKLSLEERKEKFVNEVNEQLDFDVGMRERFISYWTESNKTKTKLRFEDQKYFDTKRRLTTWRSKDGQGQFASIDKKRFVKGDLTGSDLFNEIERRLTEEYTEE